MTTADWALVISLCSAAISLAALAWNIWAKFIFPKPTVRVSFSVNRMFPDRAKVGKFLTLSATNRASSPRCLGPWPLSSHQRLRYAFRALMGRSSYYPPWPRLGGAFLITYRAPVPTPQTRPTAQLARPSNYIGGYVRRSPPRPCRVRLLFSADLESQRTSLRNSSVGARAIAH